MIFYGQRSELEVISHVLRGKANDVLVCRDRKSVSGTLYTLLVLRDRECAKRLLEVLEAAPQEEPAFLERFAQGEELVFVFPYREERRFADFAPIQMASQAVGETIAVNLVMECLSGALPWPLLLLALEQGSIQISKDNGIYFTPVVDLAKLNPKVGEAECVSRCAELLLELLSMPPAGSRRRDKGGGKLRSLELIRKKSRNRAYSMFSELYRDIKMTALPPKREGAKSRLGGVWDRNQGWMFRLLLVLCVILVIVALVMMLSQAVFGDIPLLRVFRHTFDVIGTENLHLGEGLQ